MSPSGARTAAPVGGKGQGGVTRRDLVIRYGSFAVIAVLSNLAAQRAVLALIGGEIGFILALGVGTAVGLVVKYLLDKRWIFHDRSAGMAAHGKRFSMYTLTGVVTTAIFWGTETAFWIAFEADIMREVGAVIGLSIGYVVKYNLDKRYVFTAREGA